MTYLLYLVFFVSTIVIKSCLESKSASSPDRIASSETIKIKVGNSPGSIEVADFNHDKIHDLAITSETDSSVTILLGNGNGHFMEVDHSPFFCGFSA